MNKFGLELTVKAHEDDIRSKKDKIAVVIHWCLLKKGLRFAGVGDNFAEDSGNLSEILPKEWNRTDFTWKYRELNNTPNKFILNFFEDGEILNVTLLRMSDEKSKDFAVDEKKDVFNDTELAGQKYHLVKEDEFLERAFHALLNDFFPKPREEPLGPKRKDESGHRQSGPEPSRPRGSREPGGIPDYSADPLRVGRGDLDPFGGFQAGGMIMDPRGMGSSAPGPSFPGAAGPRFDPVYPGMPNPGMMGGRRGRGGGRGGPFGGNRSFGDEMPPPGPSPEGYDDMFM